MQIFCETYGSDEIGQQKVICNTGEGDFADIAYALAEAKKVQFYNHDEELGYPASYSGIIHHTNTNDILVVTRAMRQHEAGRVVACGQELAYQLEEMLDGDQYLNALFGFPYLDPKGVVKSAGKTIRQLTQGAKPAERIDVNTLPEERRKTLARVCRLLWTCKRVAVRLPRTPEYERESLIVLQQILETLIKRDRCLISFATACQTADFAKLDRIQLLLTDTSIPESISDGLEWVTLDAVDKLEAGDEEIVYQWINEDPEVRKEFENSDLFQNTVDAGTQQMRILENDFSKLKMLALPKYYWWQGDLGDLKPIKSLAMLRRELAENASLKLCVNRQKFLQKLDSMLGNEVGSGDAIPEEMKTLMSGEDWAEYTDRFRNLIYDGIMIDDTTGEPLLDAGSMDTKAIQKKFRTLHDELYGPFLRKDLKKEYREKYKAFYQEQASRLMNIIGA